MEDQPSQLDLDYAFIDAFGEPIRDAEQLSWDNLKWCPKTKTIKPLRQNNREVKT